MKRKTISKVIDQKVDEWVASVQDIGLKNQLKKKVVVTGGCIASMFLDERVYDYDLYFTDQATAKAVAEYYVDLFLKQNKNARVTDMRVYESDLGGVSLMVRSDGVAEAEEPEVVTGMAADGEERDPFTEDVEVADAENMADRNKGEYKPLFLSQNAITLSDGVQIVLRFTGDPDKLHESYDYVHCTNYWLGEERKVTIREEALESLLTKELVYRGSKFPICSLIRIRKYLARGWTINAGQILKMVLQCGELDLNDTRVLRDQLTGVDMAYFAELIGKIRAADPTKVNSAYIAEIIDRIWE